MTGLCERCQERLGELLQWEADHPAAVALASAPPPAAQPAAQADGLASAPAARLGSAPLAAPAPGAQALAEAEAAEQALATPEEIGELWQHAQSCEECRRDLALLRGARQVLVALPAQAPPPDLRARVRAQLAAPNTSTLAHATAGEAAQIAPLKPPAQAQAEGGHSSKPWWDFWSGASASQAQQAERRGAAPWKLKSAGLPRVVWAGGGAAVAAFCVVLALQLKTRSLNSGASEADPAASTSDFAPGSGASSHQKAAAIRKPPASTSTPAGSRQKAAPGQEPSVKAASATPALKPGAPAASGNSTVPHASKGVPGPRRFAQGNRDEGGARNALPVMPAVPTPPASAQLKASAPRENHRERVARGAGSQGADERLQNQTGARSEAAATAQQGAAASSIRVQVAPVPDEGTNAPDFRASAGIAGRSTLSRPGGLAPTAGGASIQGNTDSTEAVGGASEAASGSAAASGAAAASGLGALSDTDRPRFHNRMRVRAVPEAGEPGGSALSVPASPAGPSGPVGPSGSASASSADAAPPALAAPLPGGFGGFGGGARRGQASPSGARAAASAAPMARQGAPASPASRPLTGVTAPLSTPSAGILVRQVIIEVKASRAIKRAEVEVVLAQGWLFAQGLGSRRVLWSGSTSEGQVIRVQVGLKPGRADAPSRAASVRLLDEAQPGRGDSSADIIIPAAPSKK